MIGSIIPFIASRKVRRGWATRAIWSGVSGLGKEGTGGLQGDTAKARVKYQDFLTLWKDADPEIPILKAAQAEYAKLQ